MASNETISKQEIEMGILRQQHALVEAKVHALESDAVEAAANKAELQEVRKRLQNMSHLTPQAEEQERLREQLRMTQATSQAQQVRVASSIQWQDCADADLKKELFAIYAT